MLTYGRNKITMKKNKIITCIVLSSLMAAMTACGSENNITVTPAAETTAAQTTTAAETTTNETTETTAGTTSAESAAEETVSEKTENHSAEGSASAEDIAGVWFEDAEAFLGTWGCGRATAVIDKDGSDYTVYIKWASSPADGTFWDYKCSYDSSTGFLRCDGSGTRTDYAFDTESNENKNEIIYSDSFCIFEIKDGVLYWDDDKEDMDEGMEFYKVTLMQGDDIL